MDPTLAPSPSYSLWRNFAGKIKSCDLQNFQMIAGITMALIQENVWKDYGKIQVAYLLVNLLR